MNAGHHIKYTIRDKNFPVVKDCSIDRSGQTVQTLVRLLLIKVYTVCHSVNIFLTHYSTVKPLCSNFRVITANFSGVQIFRVFMVYRNDVKHFYGQVWANSADPGQTALHRPISVHKQSDQGLHCLQFYLLEGKTTLFKF